MYRELAPGGSQLQFLPTKRGFDEYHGIPYSNDMQPSVLLQNTEVIESPVQLDTLTQRYTEQAVNFIQRSKSAPFFLYFAHTFPHVPLAASAAFRGKSALGLYADVVEEIDWSVGEVLGALQDNDIDDRTLVMFTSDTDRGSWAVRVSSEGGKAQAMKAVSGSLLSHVSRAESRRRPCRTGDIVRTLLRWSCSPRIFPARESAARSQALWISCRPLAGCATRPRPAELSMGRILALAIRRSSRPKPGAFLIFR